MRNSNITTNPTKHIPNTAQDTRVPKSHSEDIQNSAQDTNVTTNLKKHNPNSAQGTTVANHHTEHI